MRTFSAIRYYLLFFITLSCLNTSLQAQADNSFLAKHPSDYLRSHADDAVKWQAFGHNTLQLARKQQKPLLLSSGYASCYWCHRMKEDSFKNTAVGEIVNQHFIPILIDRELEPETDQWLQRFMEQQRGFGGWPLTVILTPDGQPIAGYNYTPGTEFAAALQRFVRDWEQNPQRISELGERNKAAMQHGNDGEKNAAGNNEEDTENKISISELLQALLQQLASAADNDYGGFGEQEKFPYVPQLNALFELQALNHDPALENFLSTTLSALIGGSLHDHIGGGFFRYTDDPHWSQPHYEKMLYTQALLSPLLIRAGKTWNSPIYTDIGRDTLLHMIRAFQREDGCFRSGLSAVGETGQAGGYYLWTPTQLEKVLGNDSNKIINLLGEEATLVLPFPLAMGATKSALQTKLLTERSKRTQQVDNKTLTGWNGLALSALATGSTLAPEIQRAGTILAEKLLRLSRKEEIPQLADQRAGDAAAANFTAQVYLAKGLADWGQHNATGKYLSAARQLLIRIHKRYYRKNGWIYAEDKPLLGTLIRQHLPDTQLPSASALWLQTAHNLLAMEPEENAELAALVADVGDAETNEATAVEEEAFFHATYIAERVKQQISKQHTKGATAQ